MVSVCSAFAGRSEQYTGDSVEIRTLNLQQHLRAERQALSSTESHSTSFKITCQGKDTTHFSCGVTYLCIPCHWSLRYRWFVKILNDGVQNGLV